MIDEAVDKLACYAQRTGPGGPCERIWAVNAILEALKLDSYTQPTGSPGGGDRPSGCAGRADG